MSFGSRLRAAKAAYGPLCVGIDPHPHLLEEWGWEDDFDGLRRFADVCVEAFAGQVAVVKPQSAFFERFGAVGVAVLEDLVNGLRHTGSLVLLDAKRGDIGSTAEAYAQAYLDDDQPMAVDALTVNPFLGIGSLEPFFRVAEANDAGVFALALTSNPEGPEVQQAVGADGRTVAATVLDHLRELNATEPNGGAFGAVVGATIGDTTENLDINGPLLAPGYGAQGGTVADLERIFSGVTDQVLPTTSRSVLAHGPSVAAMRAEADRLNDELRVIV